MIFSKAQESPSSHQLNNLQPNLQAEKPTTTQSPDQ